MGVSTPSCIEARGGGEATRSWWEKEELARGRIWRPNEIKHQGQSSFGHRIIAERDMRTNGSEVDVVVGLEGHLGENAEGRRRNANEGQLSDDSEPETKAFYSLSSCIQTIVSN